MSDGITESRRGSYFNNKKEQPKHSKHYWDRERNMPYKNTFLTYEDKVKAMDEYSKKYPIPPYKKQELPDARKHQIISFIKSGIRIVGYAFLPFNLVIATGVLILSEVIGIIEELV
jgi:hypothetical protein